MSKLAKALTAAAGNAGGGALYVEDVFSTYLYTGDGTTDPFPIVNGIDLANEGGLVWHKQRSSPAQSHVLVDTVRGGSSFLSTNSTNAATTVIDIIDSFNEDGFDLALNSITNTSAKEYASWTFRKAEKFFDVVTYTGTGSAQTISHNLGSDVGFMVIKRTDTTGFWVAWHKDFASTADGRLLLNTTDAYNTSSTYWNSTAPTSTGFTVGTNANTNTSGGSYIAYLFASDAGGFGENDESIIKCGSYTGTDAAQEIDVGFEPQWLLVKQVTASSSTYGDWQIVDTMRGFDLAAVPPYLEANTNNAEATGNPNGIGLTHTGFSTTSSWSVGGWDYIYIAIRRPMKTPESGTEVFAPVTRTGTSTAATITGAGFPPDSVIAIARNAASNNSWFDRLRGRTQILQLDNTNAELAAPSGSNTAISSFDMNGVSVGTDVYAAINQSGYTYINYFLKRATGFFDVVAYTGDGTNPRTINHNLGVTPELMIIKDRTATWNWFTFFEFTSSGCKRLFLNLTNSEYSVVFSDTGQQLRAEPTDSIFTVGSNAGANASGDDYIAYLFATLAGVSKVGSYTGTAADLNVDCGFSAGARFILIKRTDSTGDWYVWDSVRGIVAGNDPYLLLNAASTEVTSTDYIDPLASGFTVTSSAPAALNASGGTYLFMAIS